jgi:hypothetical protein
MAAGLLIPTVFVVVPGRLWPGLRELQRLPLAPQAGAAKRNFDPYP